MEPTVKSTPENLQLESLLENIRNLNICDSKNEERDEKTNSKSTLDSDQNYQTTKLQKIDNFYLDILANKYCKGWTTNFKKTDCYKLIPVEHSSDEFSKINHLFRSTSKNLRGVDVGHRIIELIRVENPYLLAQYLLKKEQMGPGVKQRRLFHTTHCSNVEKICKNNFNWRLSGRSRGSKYGRGISFSPLSVYARLFGDVMFVAKVLVKKITEGSNNLLIPPEPYDTTSGAGGAVIVKYEDNDYYPEYIIYFSNY